MTQPKKKDEEAVHETAKVEPEYAVASGEATVEPKFVTGPVVSSRPVAVGPHTCPACERRRVEREKKEKR